MYCIDADKMWIVWKCILGALTFKLLCFSGEFNIILYNIFRVKSGQIRNIESARVSMVGQLKRYVTLIEIGGNNSTINFHWYDLKWFWDKTSPRCSEIYQPLSDQIPSCSSSEAIAEEDEEQDETKEDVTPQQVDVS